MNHIMVIAIIKLAYQGVIQVDQEVIQVGQEVIQVDQEAIQDQEVIQAGQMSHIADHIANHIVDNNI
jgi:uncharacterized membrane protein (Fun14 family)